MADLKNMSKRKAIANSKIHYDFEKIELHLKSWNNQHIKVQEIVQGYFFVIAPRIPRTICLVTRLRRLRPTDLVTLLTSCSATV